MRKWSLIPAILLFATAAFCGQKQSSPSQRPTLGPEPAPPTLGTTPSLNGPHNFTIMNAQALRGVKTVYIGFIDNKLNLKLTDDIAKDGPFRVVTERKRADAVLEGTCFNSPHLKDVHSEVFLTGRDGKAIWEDVIHKPYLPPSLPQAVTESANLIIAHLRESIRESDRK